MKSFLQAEKAFMRCTQPNHCYLAQINPTESNAPRSIWSCEKERTPSPLPLYLDFADENTETDICSDLFLCTHLIGIEFHFAYVY